MPEIFFNPQPTPNPNAYKFVTDRTINEGPTKTFYSPEAAREDPVASKLFDITGVTGVMILANFCSVNQDGQHDWSTLIPKVEQILTDAFG